MPTLPLALFPSPAIPRLFTAFSVLVCAQGACVPSGSAPPWDGGSRNAPKLAVQAADVLTTVFEDAFDDRQGVVDPPENALLPVLAESGTSVPSRALFADGSPAPSAKLGPNWYQSKTSAWSVENGRLCGRGARNHGVWLRKPIPINARIEFDAISSSAEGDIKAELWGDGQSAATGQSYTDATSYLAILGGWKNTVHVLARLNEHGADRKELKVDKDSDDARQHPVSVGQAYRFKIERIDGKTLRWSVNGVEYMNWADADALAGIGHDHFGFNNWEVKVCYDNVKVTPL
jgi:hypothetical protein